MPGLRQEEKILIPCKSSLRIWRKGMWLELSARKMASFFLWGPLIEAQINNASLKWRQGKHFLDLPAVLAKVPDHRVSRSPLKGVKRRRRQVCSNHLLKLQCPWIKDGLEMIRKGLCTSRLLMSLNGQLGKLQLPTKCSLQGAVFPICWFPYLGLKTSTTTTKALYNELLVKA